MLELIDAVVLSGTRVSRMVDELVVAGYVTRVPNADDRRSAFAELTEAGRNAAPVYLDLIREHVGTRFTRREVAELRRILDRAL